MLSSTLTRGGAIGARARVSSPGLHGEPFWMVLPAAATAIIASYMPVESVDLWWSLLHGQSSGGVDRIVFSDLRPLPADPQWLARHLLAACEGLGGLEALVALRAGTLACSVALVTVLARRAGSGAAQACVAAWLALPLILAGGALRPQVLVLPLFALTLLLGGTLAGWRGAGLLVALNSALWANLHGSFILSPVALILLAIGGERGLLIPRARLATIATLAALANPWGPDIYRAALEVTRANNGGGVAGLAREWQPLVLTSSSGVLFTLLSMLAILGALRSKRQELAWVALAGPLAVLALSGGRHTVWFALAAVPLVARAIRLPQFHSVRAPVVLTSLVVGLGLAGVARPIWSSDPPFTSDTPVRVGDRLVEIAPARVFAFSDWGGYLAWRLKPDGRVFIDNRYEQHSEQAWSTYRRISLAEPGWERELAALRVDALVLESRAQVRLVEALDASAEWQPVYADSHGAIYARR